jgi:hypothetical protein
VQTEAVQGNPRGFVAFRREFSALPLAPGRVEEYDPSTPASTRRASSEELADGVTPPIRSSTPSWLR